MSFPSERLLKLAMLRIEYHESLSLNVLILGHAVWDPLGVFFPMVYPFSGVEFENSLSAFPATLSSRMERRVLEQPKSECTRIT